MSPGDECKVVAIDSARKAREARERQWEEAAARHLGSAGVWPEDATRLAAELRGRLGIAVNPETAAQRELKRMGWLEPDGA